MAFVDADLKQKLKLDDSPNSMQRLEMALHTRYISYDELAADPDDLTSLIAYLGPIYLRYAGGQPVAGDPAILLCRDGQQIDLHALLREVFDKMNGMVLFKACYVRLECLPTQQ